MKKQSFITGAFLLAAATGLGKIFSAIFKIPLDNLFLHAEGMAIFNGAYNIYMFFFAVATAGIPLAISQLVASSEKEEGERIVSTSLIFTTASLFIVSLAVFIFAEPIATATGMADCALSLRVMAPAITLCSITASLRGYFQGRMNMTPSALSQVTDSLGRLLAGFTGAYLLMGKPLGTISAGAISGTTVGAFLSVSVLVVFLKKSHLKIRCSFSTAHLKRLLIVAIPITVTASLHPIFNLADTLTVVPLLKMAGATDAQSAFGCLSRSAMLYALPVSIATAVAASALPAVAEHAKRGDAGALNRDASLAVRLTLAISVPCAAGFMAIPDGIFGFLFNSTNNSSTLIYIALSAVFLSIGEVLSSILQGYGKIKCTVISALVAVISKLALNLVLIRVGHVNGAAASTSLSYILFLCMLLLFLKVHTPVRLSVRAHLLKPLFLGVLCFTAAFVSAMYLPTFPSIIIAAFVYIPAVFVTGMVNIGEINQIFSGHKIEYVCK